MKRYVFYLLLFTIVLLLTGCANEVFEPTTFQVEDEDFRLELSVLEEADNIVVKTTLQNATSEPLTMIYGEDVVHLIVDGQPMQDAFRSIGYNRTVHHSYTLPSLEVEKTKWKKAQGIVAVFNFTLNHEDVEKAIQLK